MNKEKFELIKNAIEKKYVVSGEGLTKLAKYVDGWICSMIAENDYSSDNYTASGDRHIEAEPSITLNFKLPMSDIEKVLGDDVEMFRFVSSYDIGALIESDLEEMYDDQFMFEVELLVVDDLAEFHIEISIDDDEEDEDIFGDLSEETLERLDAIRKEINDIAEEGGRFRKIVNRPELPSDNEKEYDLSGMKLVQLSREEE